MTTSLHSLAYLRNSKTQDVRYPSETSIVSSHKCNACKLHWPLPREIRWPQRPTPPPGLLDVSPSTPETIVVYQTFDAKGGHPTIPEDVFRNFTFAHEGAIHEPGNRNLCKGIRFTRDGRCLSPKLQRMQSAVADDATRDHAYLTVVTLNMWYFELVRSLFGAITTVADLQGNFMLSAAMMSDESLITALGNARFVFISLWPLMLCICLYFAFAEANIEWIMKSHPAKGDLITNISKRDRILTFISMIILNFFLVPRDVKDIIISLHPWKGIQDYAAFKAEGHRAFFVGWRSKSMHRVENFRSVWCCLPPQLITKALVLFFKVYLIYRLFFFENKFNVSYSLLASCGSSSCAVLWESFQLVTIYCIRRKFYDRLVVRLTTNSEGSKQYAADVRLLMLHFHRMWDAESHKPRKPTKVEVKNGNWIGGKVKDGHCKACGRNCDFTCETSEPSESQQFSDACIVDVSLSRRSEPRRDSKPRPPYDTSLMLSSMTMSPASAINQCHDREAVALPTAVVEPEQQLSTMPTEEPRCSQGHGNFGGACRSSATALDSLSTDKLPQGAEETYACAHMREDRMVTGSTEYPSEYSVVPFERNDYGATSACKNPDSVPSKNEFSRGESAACGSRGFR